MALTQRTVYDSITILEDGQIQLRLAKVIMEDGVELTRTFHRQVIEPGQDVSLLPQRVKDVTTSVWTTQVIADYLTAKAARRLLAERIP